MRSDLGDVSVMFTGDAESMSESDIISNSQQGLLDCDILKVGHHGSNTSTSQAFLNAVSPEIAVISCGAGNSYRHPHSEITGRLDSAGVEYYRTDTQGDILIKTDGTSILVIT